VPEGSPSRSVFHWPSVFRRSGLTGLSPWKRFEVADRLAAEVHRPVLALAVPVVGVLDEQAVFVALVVEHDAGHALDELGLVERVTIRLVAEGERVTLSIEDTGIGISADESARIFERFYRCDRSRSKQGNGLGLSLALAFVRGHGGDINREQHRDKAARSPLCFPGRATASISNSSRPSA
jgi:K+-sensing histidine kinase KdpD